MKSFNEKLLIKELSQLPSKNQIFFALLAATRQLRNFEYSAKKLGLSSLDEPREILISLWDDLKKNTSNEKNYSEKYDEILDKLPEEDFQWTIWHAIAEDALSSIAYTLSALTSFSLQDVSWAARRAYEAADQVAIFLTKVDLSAAGSEEVLLSHPVVQRELVCQNDNMAFLKKELTVDMITKAETEAFNHSFLSSAEILILEQGTGSLDPR